MTPSNAKAYGKYCQNESKKHVVEGAKGTPYVECVAGGKALLKTNQNQA